MLDMTTPPRTTYMKNWMNEMYYENQRIASETIYHHFTEGHRHVYLTAEMQSGKTGSFHCTLYQMLFTNTVKNVVILCGMSDCGLYNQALKDAIHYNREYMERKQIHVIFLQHLKTNSGRRSVLQLLMQQDLLIVTDESDRDSTKDSTYHKLMMCADIPVNGDNEHLRRRNIYMLNVSATPFAEHFDSERGYSHKKQRVQLMPGEGYMGIKEFYENGQIRVIGECQPDMTEYHSHTRVEDCDGCDDSFGLGPNFCTFIHNNGYRYNIIRYHTRSYKFETFKNIATSHNFGLFVYRANYDKCSEQSPYKIDSINELLSTKPDRPSLLLIHGACRAGIVFENKQHIGSVWETSKIMNTDVFVQGLPGRVCGYNTFNTIAIFAPKGLLEPKGMEPSTTTITPPRKFSEIERFILFHKITDNPTTVSETDSEHKTETDTETDTDIMSVSTDSITDSDAKQRLHEVSNFNHGKKKRHDHNHHATASRRLPRHLVEKYNLSTSVNATSIQLLKAIRDDMTGEDGRAFLNKETCMTKAQRKELENRHLAYLNDYCEDREERRYGEALITVRHANSTNTSYIEQPDLIRSLQRSCRFEHPVRNNQGIRTDSSNRNIVVFVVHPDFPSSKQDEVSRSTSVEFYYFFRTASVSNEDPSDTNGKEQWRWSHTEEDRMRFAGAMTCTSTGQYHTHDHDTGIGYTEVRTQLIDSLPKLNLMFSKLAYDYLKGDNMGIHHNMFRITRELKDYLWENKKLHWKEKQKIFERKSHVHIDMEFGSGTYKSDDTRLIKRICIR